jgi:hypothetical protein
MLRTPSRDRFGHASLNSSTTFAVLSENMFDTPVTLPPGRGQAVYQPGPFGVRHTRHHNGHGVSRSLCRADRAGVGRDEHIDVLAEQFFHERGNLLFPALDPPSLDHEVLSFHVAQRAELIVEGDPLRAGRRLRDVRGACQADVSQPVHPRGRLRAEDARKPRARRRSVPDERPPVHHRMISEEPGRENDHEPDRRMGTPVEDGWRESSRRGNAH